MTGAELRKVRAALGLNQTEFGALLGRASFVSVSIWETGGRPVPAWVGEVAGFFARAVPLLADGQARRLLLAHGPVALLGFLITLGTKDRPPRGR